MDKEESLMKLKEEIERLPNHWVWPEGKNYPDDFPAEGKNVKGFIGAQLIIFITSKPTDKPFPSPFDKTFYKTLEEYKFTEAHITDAIKLRGKPNTEKVVELEEDFHFIEDEINILQPKLIVIVGKTIKLKCSSTNQELNFAAELKKKLKEKFPQIQIRIITHYSNTNIPKRRDQFISDFQKVREELDNILMGESKWHF